MVELLLAALLIDRHPSAALWLLLVVPAAFIGWRAVGWVFVGVLAWAVFVVLGVAFLFWLGDAGFAVHCTFILAMLAAIIYVAHWSARPSDGEKIR